MDSLDPHIFRAYDIRGKAGEQITKGGCNLIGKGFGSILREMYQTKKPLVAVGRDARVHSPAFQIEVTKGLMEVGCHVLDIGQTPSPINYFTVCTQNLDGSVQITASHNPKDDNGLKLQIRNAEAFCGDDLQRLRMFIEEGNFLEGEGSSEEMDAITPYKEHLLKMFADAGKGVSVVMDSGNGVAGPVYKEVLESVGCTVEGLYIEPDGTFPNHPADPSKWDTLKELQDTVQSKNADIGLGYDGDGDRLGVVDETGRILSADEILLLLAKDHLKRNPEAPVIFTVSNSGILETEIARWGGKPVMCKVGHSFVEHTMRKEGAKLGGEQSGHFFCGEDYFDFDDALVATLRLIAILKTSGKPLSELCAAFPKVYQTQELRPHCSDDKKSDVIKKVIQHFQQHYPVETMDGARIDFGDGAWAGIRQSNTSPKLSVCMEARSDAKLKEIEGIVLEHLKTYPEIEL